MIIETYTRIFVDAEALGQTIVFYRSLLQGEVTLRFNYPAAGLEIAAVSSKPLSVLIVSGPYERRARVEATRLTIRVDRLDSHLPILAAAGSEQPEPVQTTPVGRKTRFRHPDGSVVEYVEKDEGAASHL